MAENAGQKESKKTELSFLIDEYLVYKGMSQFDMSLYRNISLDSIKAWCCGRRVPSAYSLNTLFGDDEDWLFRARALRKNVRAGYCSKPSAKNEQSSYAANQDCVCGVNNTASLSESGETIAAYMNVPTVLFNEADKGFIKDITPSGRALFYLQKTLFLYEDDALHCLINTYGFTEEECAYHKRCLDRINTLAARINMGLRYWENVVKLLPESTLNKCLSDVSGLQVIQLLPRTLFVKHLDLLLRLKGQNYAKQYIESPHRCSYLLTDFEPWCLTLASLYEICSKAVGGSIVVAEWESINNGVSVDRVTFDNSPAGFQNWAYRDNDAEHDNYYPALYRDILDSLLYNNVLRTGSRVRKANSHSIKDIVYQLINGNVEVQVFQRTACITETGRAFLAWYEKLVKEDSDVSF